MVILESILEEYIEKNGNNIKDLMSYLDQATLNNDKHFKTLHLHIKENEKVTNKLTESKCRSRRGGAPLESMTG